MLVGFCALIMGVPTLRGTFVGGDDYRLVLNHVLVNHPSWSHALELFRIVHRDLYQPIPLLSFSAEFAIANTLGWLDQGIEEGAWFFHLTNVLLHAVNAMLVWVLVRKLSVMVAARASMVIATTSALLFAVHPLQVEVVAWINGRMMLLSTLFALLALLQTHRFLIDGRLGPAVLSVPAATACMMCKVRVEFPMLMILVMWSVGFRLNRRRLALLLIHAALAAVFVVINYRATDEAGMFEGAIRHLHGPQVVRALRSLAWYVHHFVVPVGLASWYPAPVEVGWSDRETWTALGVLAPVVALGIWSIRFWPTGVMGLTWFLAAIASTVQLVPTRNTLAADRYMYLPVIGLAWMVGGAGWALVGRLGHRAWMVTTVKVVGVILLMILVGQSWHVASFYDNQVVKSERIASLFPTTPHVWERVAWAYHRAGRYEEAIIAARRELVHADPEVRSDALEAVGAAEFERGELDAARKALETAIDLDPDHLAASYRLALLEDRLGRTNEAIALLERAVAGAPLKNPWILRLAGWYRREGRFEDARRSYEQALANNPGFEVPAILALSELELAEGTPDALGRAQRRLEALFSWMPENLTARVNLGVVYRRQGRLGDATQAYEEVLARAPNHPAALLNRAQLAESAGHDAQARRDYLNAAKAGLDEPEAWLAIHDFLIRTNDWGKVEELWGNWLESGSHPALARAMLAWTRIDSDDLAHAQSTWDGGQAGSPRAPFERAVVILLSLELEQYDEAIEAWKPFLDAADRDSSWRHRLLSSLERADQRHPDRPWAVGLAAGLLMVEGQKNAAGVFVNVCEDRCKDDRCGVLVDLLKRRLNALADP